MSEIEPLWNNRRIGKLVQGTRADTPLQGPSWIGYDAVRDATKRMRDEYETERKKLYARIADLERLCEELTL